MATDLGYLLSGLSSIGLRHGILLTFVAFCLGKVEGRRKAKIIHKMIKSQKYQ